MTKHISPEDYAASFNDQSKEGLLAQRALTLALDVRKFETELYWKRATYFWAFTGAAFAGYLTVLTGKELRNRADALLLVSCLGLVFSVAWYFVNRASKFWQANWEAHVDLLEDKVMGPIYKTVVDGSYNLFKIADPYSFSVTKINQLLSFFVSLVFVGLVLNTLYEYYTFSCTPQIFPTVCTIFTVLALVVLYWLGRTAPKNRTLVFTRRTTAISSGNG